MAPGLRAAWRRLVPVYKGVALFSMNVLVVLLVLNLAAAWWVRARHASRGRRMVERWGEGIDDAYQGRSREQIEALLQETWSRSYEYEPFTGFRERPYDGRYVRVHAAGFRHVKEQGPWPPSASQLNIFVFGGSTTFGYGVADDETVPSALQESLRGRTVRPARVYNFARGHYYSSQERVLFERLIATGFVPDLAVFVDGLNEFHQPADTPAYSSQMKMFFERSPGWGADTAQWLERLPVSAFARWMIRGSRGAPRREPQVEPSQIGAMIDLYLKNTAMEGAVAAAADVPVMFVWQPISTYRFDLDRHPLRQGLELSQMPGLGYTAMAQRVRALPPAPERLWAADIQDDVPDPLYVDGVHYAPNLARALAGFIASALTQRGFLRGHEEPTQASGAAQGKRGVGAGGHGAIARAASPEGRD